MPLRIIHPPVTIRSCSLPSASPSRYVRILAFPFRRPTRQFAAGRDMATAKRDDDPPSRRDWGSWWRRALGQRLNAAGVFWFVSVVAREPRLSLPHISVPDISWIDWESLERAGFRGVVFDKDNTLTAPYSLSLWPSLANSFSQCQSVFPGRVSILSNSAGLFQYDPHGFHARELEMALKGVHVIRHGAKKPSGSSEEVEKYFGCSTSSLIMVGDRYFTDVVYGNRNGFLTILTQPLSLTEEPFIVQQELNLMCQETGTLHQTLCAYTPQQNEVRKLEQYLVNRWHRNGIEPAQHILLKNPRDVVKMPSI